MAEQLDDFQFKPATKPYPWGDWLNGKVWKLTMGKDFSGSLVSFRSNVYRRADQLGMSVRTQFVSETEIVIQANDNRPVEVEEV